MVQLTMHLMTTDEARSCIDRINTAMDTARALLLELREREGWRALGYESWRACAVAEFDQSQTRVYELVTAARVDREISAIAEIEPIRESHARELAPLLKQPDTLREVYAEVQEQTQERPTALDYRQAVDRRLGIERPRPTEPEYGYDEPIAEAQGVPHISYALPDPDEPTLSDLIEPGFVIPPRGLPPARKAWHAVISPCHFQTIAPGDVVATADPRELERGIDAMERSIAYMERVLDAARGVAGRSRLEVVR